MKFYIITCRLAFDDEDSLYIIRADSADAATADAQQQMREEHNDPTNDFYVNYVVECDHEPTVIQSAPGM